MEWLQKQKQKPLGTGGLTRDRLTKIHSNGLTHSYYSDASKGELIDRLAAYEDTGLMPSEVEFILGEYERFTKMEREGRLIVLPCKVGDTVYGMYPPMAAFGKTVFLTREEAEAALGGDGDAET